MLMIEKEGKLDKDEKKIYEDFIKYENIILLKSWTTNLIKEGFDKLAVLQNPEYKPNAKKVEN